MGTCESCHSKIPISPCQPPTLKELKELYNYESAICKIKSNLKNGDKIVYRVGTGFFCELNDEDIPFNLALFTNNHVLNETRIKNNMEIKFEYLNENRTIKMTTNRRKFTNKDLDYTCIQIFESDKIDKFFKIDKLYFEKKNILKDIVILQYPEGKKISHSIGKIIGFKNDIISHNASTLGGSSGSPLIKRYNINLIIGIHHSTNKEINLATPFDIIIKDLKYKLTENTIINLIYDTNYSYSSIKYTSEADSSLDKELEHFFEDYSDYSLNSSYDFKHKYNIFGSKFVNNNINNIKLKINGKEYQLMDKYALEEGVNNIQLIIINKLTNLEEMFLKCKTLKNIDELKYLNTEEVYNFRGMFCGCISLTEINALKNWNVSNGSNFSGMFGQCLSLSNIKGLEKWDVSNGIDFSTMFTRCLSLSDINSLKNWDVSNGNKFESMFLGCSSLTNLKGLEKWNVSNAKYFSAMFTLCRSLQSLKGLEKWNVFNGINFLGMFWGCSSLQNLKELKNWNVSNIINFERMFGECKSLSDISALKNWNSSKVKNFMYMFNKCSSLSNLKGLENWDVSNGKNFKGMFSQCISLTDINALSNWNVTNGNNFDYLFQNCTLLSDIKVLQNWNVSNGKEFYRIFEGCSPKLDLKVLQNWNNSKFNK